MVICSSGQVAPVSVLRGPSMAGNTERSHCDSKMRIKYAQSAVDPFVATFCYSWQEPCPRWKKLPRSLPEEKVAAIRLAVLLLLTRVVSSRTSKIIRGNVAHHTKSPSNTMKRRSTLPRLKSGNRTDQLPAIVQQHPGATRANGLDCRLHIGHNSTNLLQHQNSR